MASEASGFVLIRSLVPFLVFFACMHSLSLSIYAIFISFCISIPLFSPLPIFLFSPYWSLCLHLHLPLLLSFVTLFSPRPLRRTCASLCWSTVSLLFWHLPFLLFVQNDFTYRKRRKTQSLVEKGTQYQPCYSWPLHLRSVLSSLHISFLNSKTKILISVCDTYTQ